MAAGRRRRWVWVVPAALLLLLASVSWMTLPASLTSGSQPMLSGAVVPPAALAIIQRSCADCHSDSTRFPWYAKVAPVSWWLAGHVREGRRQLNLSEWNAYPPARRLRALSTMANMVEQGDMPIPSYLWLHRDARLSEEDITVFRSWTRQERARVLEQIQRAQ